MEIYLILLLILFILGIISSVYYLAKDKDIILKGKYLIIIPIFKISLGIWSSILFFTNPMWFTLIMSLLFLVDSYFLLSSIAKKEVVKLSNDERPINIFVSMIFVIWILILLL